MKSSSRKRTKVTITAFAASVLVGALSSAAMAQNNPVANFDQGYLDEHPRVAQQLSANPNLVDDPQFMQSHPGLQRYLSNHPGVRNNIKQNPGGFMNSANQLNSSNPSTGGNGQGPAGRFERGYLDRHPDVGQQLAAHPSLVNDPQFMANHPGLQKYLANHPQVQQDLQNHPNRFMGREGQLNERQGNPNGNQGIGSTDHFLATHPKAAQRLEHNPNLINNPQFRTNHPQLQNYLNNHPGAQNQWREHPYGYMRNANRYRRTH